MDYQAHIYPREVPDAPEAVGFADTPKLGLCLSGGGSRAMTVALGALSGLTHTQDPHRPGTRLIDHVQWLSSVSGGSWASVLYTYTPEVLNGQPVSDSDLLIQPIEPGDLRTTGDAPQNVDRMDPRCIGSAPPRIKPLRIAELLLELHHWKFFKNPEKWRWLWIYMVGELILKDHGLYHGELPTDGDALQPERFFSESNAHIDAAITRLNPSLTGADFYTARAGRKPLFVNYNLLQDVDQPDPVQTPIQASIVEVGIPGESPDGTIRVGPSCEAFAFASEHQGAADGNAVVAAGRRYSLVDITGCSSAFFAELLVEVINRDLESILGFFGGKWFRKLRRWFSWLFPAFAHDVIEFLEKLERRADGRMAELIPRYNFWNPAQVDAANNQVHGFSDGGNFDNTGILGMLARTPANRIVAVVSTVEPLIQMRAGVQVAQQLPLLFGYQDKPDADGNYSKWPEQRSAQYPMSFVQVFSDDNGEFDALREGLAAASRAGTDLLATGPATFLQKGLVTVENRVAGIAAGRKVDVLWVYNNRVNDWQEQLSADKLKDDIASGQRAQNPDGSPHDQRKAHGPMKNFPWYSTADVGLDTRAVNALAQMSAWVIEQNEETISSMMD